MTNYVIITENDESDWDDLTGIQYHFPAKYKNLLLEGSKVLYYKGTLKNKAFKSFRLSDEPHYFGIGVIETISKEDGKNNYFAKISNYKAFEFPVPFKINGDYLEYITNPKNHWRDAVRKLDEETFNKVIELAKLSNETLHLPEDDYLVSHSNEILEGKKVQFFTTKYERNKSNRDLALKIHGFNCSVCDINFEETYGEIGKGFIHIHHIKPLFSLTEEVKIDPVNDLVPVCPNCHAIIHRMKNKVLSIDEMRSIYKKR